MEVNLKALQDAGAMSHQSPVKPAGFSVTSAPETLNKAAEVRPKPSNVVNLKKTSDSTTLEKETSEQTTLNKEVLQGIATELTKFMQSLSTDLQFSIHEKSGRMLVRVVDSSSHEVLKEFPPEELLDTIGAIREYVGALLDKKA